MRDRELIRITKRLREQSKVLQHLTKENIKLKKKLFNTGLAAKAVLIESGWEARDTTLQGMKDKLKMGGCCLCGYKRCLSAIDFHHVKTKTRDISKITNISNFIGEITNHEIVLLCATCHRELHAGEIHPDFTGRRVVLSDQAGLFCN
jgi:hypothetical protein